MRVERAALIALLALAVLASPAIAQETIFDPENPGSGGLDENDSGESDGVDERVDGGLFTIEPGFFRGSYLGRLYLDTRNERDDEDVFLLQNRLDLRFRLRFSSRWTAVIEGRLEHRLWGQGDPDGAAMGALIGQGEGYQGFVEARLGEAFVSGRLGDDVAVQLTVGNQSIVWGAGTLSQPAAFINPVDYRSGVFDTPADQRLAVPAAVVDVLGENVALSLVFVPFFEPHLIDVIGTDFSVERAFVRATGLDDLDGLFPRPDDSLEPLLRQALLVTVYPEATPENVSAGARLTGTAGGVDLGFGYFFGWDRLPFVEIDTQLLIELLSGIEQTGFIDGVLDSRYRRMQALELDMVTYLGELGVRVESVFQPKRTLYEPLGDSGPLALLPQSVRKPTLTTALAFSWEESSSFVIQLEGLWLHVFDPDAESELVFGDRNTWAGLFAVLFDFERIDALGGSFLADLSVQVSGLVGLDEGDVALYPTLRWSATDFVAISAGAQLFFGPDPTDVLTIGGVFSENDQVFVGVEATF